MPKLLFLFITLVKASRKDALVPLAWSYPYLNARKLVSVSFLPSLTNISPTSVRGKFCPLNQTTVSVSISFLAPDQKAVLLSLVLNILPKWLTVSLSLPPVSSASFFNSCKTTSWIEGSSSSQINCIDLFFDSFILTPGATFLIALTNLVLSGLI